MREALVRTILANRLAAAAWCLGLLAGVVSAGAQVYQPPPPPLTAAPCVPTKKDPCTQPDVTPATPATTERFPFPGETPAPGAGTAPASAPAAGAPSSFPFPGEPEQPAPGGVSPADAGKAHPFPGEPGDAPGSSSSSSSSSSSGDAQDADSAPSKPGLKDEGSSGSTRFERHHLPKVEDKDTREEQDLQVSKYYASTGNYKAAYLRAKDAIATVPDDPEGHFLLADAAQHFGKRDEARTEFAAYLKLDPDGDHVKAAEKALAELTPK